MSLWSPGITTTTVSTFNNVTEYQFLNVSIMKIKNFALHTMSYFLKLLCIKYQLYTISVPVSHTT